MNILVTGFEPFGGEKTNPSWEAVQLLPTMIGNASIHALRLPVVFGQCGEMLRQAVQNIHPDAVLLCGMAASRTEVTPELLAVNWRMGAIADNSGKRYQGEKNRPDGPDAIMTDFPLTSMVAALQDAGIPARLSLSAGAYVCNDLYYAALGIQQAFDFRALFVHVPSASALPVEEIARALTICLETMIPA